jgi:acetylglutamate kinase
MTPLTVKLGGVAGAHAAGLQALIARATPDWVIVHGGGAEVADWSVKLGLQPKTHDGLRVTDGPTLDVVVAVLRGLVNARLVAAFNAGGRRAVGLCGTDAGLLEVVPADAALGYVGHVAGVDLELLAALHDAGLIPIVAPVAADAGGQLRNVNADEAAGAIAGARKGRLLLLTDVAAVERDGQPVAQLDLETAKAMLEDGSASGGMRPKLRAAILAATAGCAVRIVDGRDPQAITAALDGEPIGTEVTAGRIGLAVGGKQ